MGGILGPISRAQCALVNREPSLSGWRSGSLTVQDPKGFRLWVETTGFSGFGDSSNPQYQCGGTQIDPHLS